MLMGVSDLLTSWRALLPAAPAPLATRVGADLLARWGEPHRHYHTVSHLAFVLAVIDEHATHAVDATAVRLAAWFHDAIYDPHRVDNEEASALLAESSLPGMGVSPDRVAEVARLIRLTASHDPAPGDRNGELLSDADLAVLASPPETYASYTTGVRREYAHVSDADFAVGRASVLHNLLSLARLYHTPALRERWEEAARANVSRELRLTGQVPEETRNLRRT
jgi:predicted metal-dependent HD superfamily phosphohydrolase